MTFSLFTNRVSCFLSVLEQSARCCADPSSSSLARPQLSGLGGHTVGGLGHGRALTTMLRFVLEGKLVFLPRRTRILQPETLCPTALPPPLCPDTIRVVAAHKQPSVTRTSRADNAWGNGAHRSGASAYTCNCIPACSVDPVISR